MEKLSLPAVVCIVFLFCAAAAIAAPAQGIFFTSLASFDGTDGADPQGALIQATDGNFYGTTCYGGSGGASGPGTVFRITPTGTLTTLHSFDLTDGDGPYAGLVQASDGNFYGTTAYGGAYSYGTVFKINADGTLTTLHSFDADGAWPYGGLVQASDANFYGTTNGGGTNIAGTVFKITPGGTLTTLYSFCSQPNCADGSYPYGGLLLGSAGNFYGTTLWGGATNSCGSPYFSGCGTVFKITPGGTLTTLYSFSGSDGANPPAALVQGADGNVYGTTVGGGTSTSCSYYYGVSGCGTVFKITPAGTLITLHSFDGSDGAFPWGGLVQAADGNFYGTTNGGGANNAGTVFKITAAGTLTTLYSFCSQANCTDGAGPSAGLVQATDGNFCGTTGSGGASTGCYGQACGTVFRLGVLRECAICGSLNWRRELR